MNQQTKRIPRIGEIYMMQFNGSGSEQTGWRPGLVFQNNLGNRYSPNIIALPLTSAVKKTEQPTHVSLPKEIGLKIDSMVLAENPERMSKEKMGWYIATVPHEYMEKVAVANLLATSAVAFINPDTLMQVWENANSLNNYEYKENDGEVKS